MFAVRLATRLLLMTYKSIKFDVEASNGLYEIDHVREMLERTHEERGKGDHMDTFPLPISACYFPSAPDLTPCVSRVRCKGKDSVLCGFVEAARNHDELTRSWTACMMALLAAGSTPARRFVIRIFLPSPLRSTLAPSPRLEVAWDWSELPTKSMIPARK